LLIGEIHQIYRGCATGKKLLIKGGQILKQYAFIGDDQEGITLDDEGYLYIAQDSGGIIKIRYLGD